jgi:hypothetical protein
MARLFNGSTDGINLGLPRLYPIGPPITLCAWINYNNTSNDGNIFALMDVGAEVCELRANRGSNGLFTFYLKANLQTQIDSTTTSASRLNLWTHILGTYDGTTQTLCINGVQEGTASNSLNFSFASPTWDIGRDFANNANSFSGSVGDCGLWNAVLSAQEIYALGKGYLRPYQVRPQKLISFFPLDGYGHPALDRGYAKNNGVLTGTTFAPGPPLLSAAPILTMPPSNQAMSPIMFVPPPAFILMPQIVM